MIPVDVLICFLTGIINAGYNRDAGRANAFTIRKLK
jgi:hypothetical protein